jgi:hypothetical protein
MKRIILILLALLALGLLSIGLSSTYLNSTVSNEENRISTSDFLIATTPEPFMNIAGLSAGGPAQSADVLVYTPTQTKFFYRVRASKKSGSTKLWNALMVKVEDLVTGESWTGKISNLSSSSELAPDWFARENGVLGGGSGNGHPIRFTVWLPQEADVNSNADITVKFNFEAEQWR